MIYINYRKNSRISAKKQQNPLANPVFKIYTLRIGNESACRFGGR